MLRLPRSWIGESSLFGVPMAFDAGTILFPVSYIFGDILTEVLWIQTVTARHLGRVFLPGADVGHFLDRRPDAWRSDMAGIRGDAAYIAILGGISTAGIVLASLAGFWTGEFTNSFILARMKVLTNGRWLWMRTIGSTIFGELVDTVVVCGRCSSIWCLPVEFIHYIDRNQLSFQMRRGGVNDSCDLSWLLAF